MRRTLLTTTAILAPTFAYAVSGNEEGNWVLILVVLLLSFALYFLPTFIGVRRDVNSCAALVIVNFLLGWTVIFWLVCLIWAVVGKTTAEDAFYRRASQEAWEKQRADAQANR